MNIKTILAVLAGLVLAACAEDVIENIIVMKTRHSLTVEVMDEFAATTRADYSGFPSTSFETGDAIGIYAFDGSSYVASNIRFVRQSDGSWLPDEEVSYVDGYTYYAYFPYRATTYTPSTSGTVDAVDTRFDNFISDASNYFWQAEQSTKANFTACNLMIAKGTITDTDDDAATVKFTMKHKRGLVVFSGEDASKVTFTGNNPYNSGDKCFFIMKPSVSTSFTDVTGTYSLKASQGKYVTHDISIEHLTFIALEDGTFSFTNTVEYSLDYGTTWNVLAANTPSPTVKTGERILWRGTLNVNTSTGIGTFSSTGNYEVKGCPNSLIEGSNFIYSSDYAIQYPYQYSRLFRGSTKLKSAEKLKLSSNTNYCQYCYNQMFQYCTSLTTAPALSDKSRLGQFCYNSMFDGCTSLTSAPDLPSTHVEIGSYQSMFSGCTSLTSAPALPATNLRECKNCYRGMFSGCTSLTSAPALPATNLTQSDYCYYSMFSDCTSLTSAPALPATTLAPYCYQQMFSGCTSLTSAPALPATNLTQTDYCYYSMFSDCTSLTSAPALPATTLAPYCYQQMFSGCTSLTSAPALPATTLANYCYNSMFSGCTSLTSAPALPATTLANYCYNSMFSGCTSLTSAPALPATTLKARCYSSMFNGCTSLTSAPALLATTLANYCYSSMFNGCTSLTSAPALPATTLAYYCYYSMFNGCSNLGYIKAMFTSTPGTSYTKDWVKGVKAVGTFIKSNAATWDVTGVNGIPSGWTVETAAN